MENNDRVSFYAWQRGIDTQEHPLDDSAPWLTPAQRRRVKHKDNSPKTHGHDGLLVVEGDKVRRQPCQHCSPPARTPRRVGGTR
jgi:hypothetical protein